MTRAGPSKFFANLSVMGVGMLLALLLLEVAFRVLNFGVPHSWNDRPAAYFLPKDGNGLSDFSYSEKKSANTFRIAVVGDSFSFGPYMQFDDTFAKRLERWLNLNGNGPKVEVINYGVPSYSTTNEVAIVEKALQNDADLILLQITLNDPELKPLRPQGSVDPEAGQPTIRSSLLKHWKSLSYLLARIHNTLSVRRYEKHYANLFSNWKTFGPFKDALGRISQLCKKHGKPVVAVVFPLFGHSVDERYPFRPIHTKVAQTLAQFEIKSIDLLEAYHGIPLERLQVLPGQDRHPNEIAHRIAAERLMEWLPSTGYLPAQLYPAFTSKHRLGITTAGK